MNLFIFYRRMMLFFQLSVSLGIIGSSNHQISSTFVRKWIFSNFFTAITKS